MPVVTLAGSPSPQSRSSHLLDFAAARLRELGAEVEQISVRELPAKPLLQLDNRHPAIEKPLLQIARASAVIVASPIYKAAYAGLLKTFLDLLPQDALRGKVVLPVATGGSLAHSLALDYTLKPVLSALGAGHVLASIYAIDLQVEWSPDAGLQLDPEIARRIESGLLRLTEAVNFFVRAPARAAAAARAGADSQPQPARCWG
jgi:FMN reductase